MPNFSKLPSPFKPFNPPKSTKQVALSMKQLRFRKMNPASYSQLTPEIPILGTLRPSLGNIMRATLY